MAEADPTQFAQSSPPADPARTSRHRNLIWTSAILPTVGMLVTAGYGISRELLVLWALALDMSLTALATWLSMNSCRLRRQAALEEQAEQTDTTADTSQGRFSRWEGRFREMEDGDDQMADAWDVEHARKLHYLFLAVVPTSLVVLLAARELWTSGTTAATAPSTSAATALAMVCLAVSCVWLILSRTYHSISKDDLPESQTLALDFATCNGQAF